MDQQTLQALRNVTREHIRLLELQGYSTSEARSVTCVLEALHVMRRHDFKQDRML